MGLPIGSQTYPHRQRIKNGDLAGLCADMAALGIGSIELCSPSYEEFASLADGKQTRKIIEDHGLKCPSAHFDLAELRNKQEQAITWAHDIGMTQMGAGIGLVLYFVGAVISHLRVGDVKGIGPAAFMLVLAAGALALRVVIV